MDKKIILSLLLIGVIFLAGCTSTTSDQSDKSTSQKQQALITTYANEMLPTRAEIPTEFIMESVIDITTQTKNDPSISGLDAAFLLPTYKIEGSSGLISVDYSIYKFSTSEDATKYYDRVVSDIVQEGGYTQISLSGKCFGYKEDFGFQDKLGSGICVDRNVVFMIDFASSNSFKSPDDFIKDGIGLLNKKVG